MAETERKLACGALEGDVRAFRALYDRAFRLAWAFTTRATGDARLAEALTARALRGAFVELPALAGGRTPLGVLVLRCADEALRELAHGRIVAEPLAGAPLK